LWLAASSSNGTLTSGGAAAIVSVGLNAAAGNLTVGAYTNILWFTNLNDSLAQSRQFILTVSQAAPLLSWTMPSAVVYGAALGSNQLDATANVPGSFAYNPSAGTVLSPGTNTLSVIFIPADTVDYSSATGNVSLVVSVVPIALNIQLAGNYVTLSWNDPASVFALQAAPAATGVFTNVPGAASPYTNAITGAQQFFQLASQTNLDSAP